MGKKTKKLKDFGPNVSPTRYVIFAPDHDDYLSLYKSDGEAATLGWHFHPEKALKFPSLRSAEKVAHQIFANQQELWNKKYRIQICELHESEAQFAVTVLAEIIPNAAPPKNSSAPN